MTYFDLYLANETSDKFHPVDILVPYDLRNTLICNTTLFVHFDILMPIRGAEGWSAPLHTQRVCLQVCLHPNVLASEARTRQPMIARRELYPLHPTIDYQAIIYGHTCPQICTLMEIQGSKSTMCPCSSQSMCIVFIDADSVHLVLMYKGTILKSVHV